MKVPYSWLRELCPTDRSPEEVADALTEHGVEVDRVLRPWGELAGVVVAEVLEVADHPNADKLSLATVHDGSAERHVVAGVRNMRPGDLVPYAPPGAVLPGGMRLERRALRGEVSEGMLCSPKELALSGDHTGIMILPAELERGRDLAQALGLDEAVLDIDVYPNRPDLFSVLGVAREVAAVTGGELRPPDTSVREGDAKAADAATVEVLDPGGCPRYLARIVRGVTIGPSPLPIQVRLSAAGMRPISNVVDATNYVLLEMGQPLHPFDLATLAGQAIVVRRAGDGERLTTLDGVERAMTGDDLLIADAERGIAIAGVMGGAETEVGEGTTDVLLESATFDPTSVLRTARRHGLRTEASIRFERGADPEAAAPAAARAADLIAEWSGGAVLAGAIDVGESPRRASVSVRPARAAMLLGEDVGAGEVTGVMDLLGIEAAVEGDAVRAEIPGYRRDLRIEADLIEEVGRIRGYGSLPSTLPGIKTAGGLDRDARLRRAVQDALARAGFHEVRSVSFVAERDLGLFDDARREGVRVANPISEAESFLRPSLLPGLLRAAATSVSRGRGGLRLFELGHAFRAGDPPVEDERVAVLVHGPSADGWPGDPRPMDYLDAKGGLEALLGELGIDDWSLREPAGPPYHPGRSARLLVAGEPAGELGELHPAAAEGFGLEGRAAAFEAAVKVLVQAARPLAGMRDLSRYPPVRRDVAFLVDAGVAAGAVRDALVEAAGSLLDRAILFDVFEGDPVPSGKKSLAFSVDLRAPDRTLTDDEANEVVGGIAGRLAADFGAQLRAG